MGYMGFGMQKWIYSQKPRKYFSRTRKRSGNADAAGFRDTFDINKAYEKTSRISKKSIKKVYSKIDPYPFWYIMKRIILPFLIALMILGFLWYFISKAIQFPAL